METTTSHEYTHDEEHEPHMPAPSLSPIILAAGMVLLGFGLIFGAIVIIAGAVLTLLGLGTWLYDEIQNASTSNLTEQPSPPSQPDQH
jgi:hypothetical protein